MLIAVGSAKGSPGASTFAALLAGLWPGDDVRRLLVEADADGGVFAAWWHEALGTSWSPGLVEVATASRRGASMSAALDGRTQPVGGGVELVAGVPTRTAMAAAVSALSAHGLAELAASPTVAVADVGRFGPATIDVVAKASLTLVVARPQLADAQLLRPLVEDLGVKGSRPVLVSVGSGAYSVDDLAEAAGAEVGWSIPVDGRAAALVGFQGPGVSSLRRSKLGRAIRGLADTAATAEFATPTAPQQVLSPPRSEPVETEVAHHG